MMYSPKPPKRRSDSFSRVDTNKIESINNSLRKKTEDSTLVPNATEDLDGSGQKQQ